MCQISELRNFPNFAIPTHIPQYDHTLKFYFTSNTMYNEHKDEKHGLSCSICKWYIIILSL